MKFNINDLLKRDDIQQQEQVKEDNVSKVDNFRAGNSGIMLDDGNIAGSCHRMAYLRSKGVDLEADENRLIMFEFGRQNEAIVIDKLKRVIGDSFVITGDDVNTIEWTLKSGRKVTGRPDVIIAAKDGKPILLLELKMVSSIWTARDVVFSNAPKLAHIIQATHYANKLGVPAKIVYIQPVDFQVPWKIAELPDKGQILSELIEYTEKENKKTGKMECTPKKILPSRTVYDLELDGDGYVKYRKEGSKGGYTSTPVSMALIENFYEFLDGMEAKGLGPRPLSLKPTGDFASYTMCQYCEVASFCDRFERNADKWLEEIKKAHAAGNLKK